MDIKPSRDPNDSWFNKTGDWLSQMTLVEVMIVVVIVGLLAAMTVPLADLALHRESRQHERYDLWCKVYDRHDLSYDEFVKADKAGMIPKR